MADIPKCIKYAEKISVSRSSTNNNLSIEIYHLILSPQYRVDIDCMTIRYRNIGVYFIKSIIMIRLPVATSRVVKIVDERA